MSLNHGARIVTDGLLFAFDAANIKSYPGSGTTWYDMGPNGYDANYINSSTTVHSYDSVEKAMDFQGGEIEGDGGFRISGLNYVSGSSDQIENLTIENWVKCFSGTSGNSSDQRIILSFDRSSVFRWTISSDSGNSSTGKPSFMFVDGSQRDRNATSFPDLRDDQWHHLAVTFESGVSNGLKYYLDGVLTHTDTGNYNPIGSQSTSETPRYGVIGGGSEISSESGTVTSPESFFYGKIATCNMYYKTFSADEVKQNFNALRGRFGL